MSFNNKIYDRLKWIAQYLLPGLGTLYITIAQIWHLPYAEEIVGTIMAVDTLLGIILGISTAAYKGEGSLIFNFSESQEDGNPLMYADLNLPVEEILKYDSVTFKVETFGPRE